MYNYQNKIKKLEEIDDMLKYASMDDLDEIISLLQKRKENSLSRINCEDTFRLKISEILEKENIYLTRTIHSLKRENKVYIFDLLEMGIHGEYKISITSLFTIRNLGLNSVDYLIDSLINAGVKKENFMLYGMNNTKKQINFTKNSYISKTKHEFLKKLS